MTAVLPRFPSERVVIPGPAGDLEGLVDRAADGDVRQVAVLCHPHPRYGGTMTNKVVYMLAKAFTELGAVAVRFNYRGVGASGGSYDDGNGETDDALAVIDWALQRWPEAQLWLGGFSFGGSIAIKAATRRPVGKLVTVAPAIARIPIGAVPQVDWLVVQGDSDELVDAAHIQQWVASLDAPPELLLMPGVGHFFHGHLTEMRNAVVRWGSQTREQES